MAKRHLHGKSAQPEPIKAALSVLKQHHIQVPRIVTLEGQRILVSHHEIVAANGKYLVVEINGCKTQIGWDLRRKVVRCGDDVIVSNRNTNAEGALPIPNISLSGKRYVVIWFRDIIAKKDPLGFFLASELTPTPPPSAQMNDATYVGTPLMDLT